MNALAESLAGVPFLWWEDAIEHARWLAAFTGRRRRVVYDRHRQLWRVRPAVERS